MRAPRQSQPWPMKWIIVAIILIIVPYTVLTLRYRKPGPAFQPYEDMKNRANVSRLLDAGYQRLSIPAQRSADTAGLRGGAAITTNEGGLPAELRITLVEIPQLPTEIVRVTAAPDANTLLPYSIQFTCTLPSDKQQLGGAALYIRGDTIVITPTFEPLVGTLQSRSREDVVLLTIPAGTLKPGNYTITLVAEGSSRSWPLAVK